MQKKVLLIFSIIFFIMALLLFFKIGSINLIWAVVFAFPMLLIADLCYVTLPITIPVLFGLSIYSVVKKDYQKFNYAFEILLIVITCGIINFIIDRLLNNIVYVSATPCYRVFGLMFLLCAFVFGIIKLREFKDNRVYIWTFVPMIFFYMLFEVIKAAE